MCEFDTWYIQIGWVRVHTVTCMIWPSWEVVVSSGKRHIRYGYDVQQDGVGVLKAVEVCIAVLDIVEFVGVGCRYAFEAELSIVISA